MKKNNNIYIMCIFFIFNILSFIDMYIVELRVGLLSSIFIVILLLINNKYLYQLGNKKNLLFMIYIIVSIFSIAGYLVNDRPIEFYIKSISYNLIPSMLYIIGMLCAYKKNKYIKALLYSNSLLLFIGLLIYFIFPEFYWENFYASGGSLLRFGSYIGSIQVGSIAVASIPLIFSKDLKIGPKLKPIMLIISIISTILSAQRSAYINLIIITILIIIVNINQKNKINIIKTFRVSLVMIISIIIIYEIINNLISDQLKDYYLIRIINMDSNMITERSGQWLIALEYFLKFPLGMGLGSGGDKASAQGLLLIPDGSYLRILVETGIIGTISFIGTNILAISNKKANIYNKIALFSFITAAIGSNVFDLYYSSFMYWALLGYIVNEREGFETKL